jgi:hypothetical protein
MARQPGLALSRAVLDWTPTTSYQPRWTPDRADDFRRRWRATATATMPPKESR